MREFANKLTFQPNAGSGNLPTAIFGVGKDFGAALDLNRPRLRIGLWPFQSSTYPEIALGIATVLGLLLERWQDVRVYRLFAQLDSEPAQYEWNLAKSQFTVDDWQLEGLDENIAIWGELENIGEGCELTINIENDLIEAGTDEEVKSLSYVGKNITTLLAMLPRTAVEIAEFLNAGNLDVTTASYNIAEQSNLDCDNLLKQLFHWELNLYLSAWGRIWPTENVYADQDALLAAAKTVNGELGAWTASYSVARAMLPIFNPVAEMMIPALSGIISSFPSSTVPGILLSDALFRSGKFQDAYNLLEADIKAHPESASTRLALADLYRRGGRIAETIDTFQSAIEDAAVNPLLFMRYAEFMITLDYQGWPVEEFILIDPGERQSEFLLWEAVEACYAALQLDENNLDALALLVLRLIDLDTSRLWAEFKRLVKLDKTGEKVRQVIDSIEHIEDISPAIEALRNAIKHEPERFDLYLNLGAAYLIMEQGDLSKSALDKAKNLVNDSFADADINRLMLSAEDPDFEAHLGELTDLIGAGSILEVEDVDFLEAAIAKVPTFAEGYLLLAKAYMFWEESDAVLETLLDGQKNLPDDPDILELLARTLWGLGEGKLAFDYLNRGLAKNSSHVPLLALTGQYLFENGQETASKPFFARAQAIAPNHPALNEARVNIAKNMDNN